MRQNPRRFTVWNFRVKQPRAMGKISLSFAMPKKLAEPQSDTQNGHGYHGAIERETGVVTIERTAELERLSYLSMCRSSELRWKIKYSSLLLSLCYVYATVHKLKKSCSSSGKKKNFNP